MNQPGAQAERLGLGLVKVIDRYVEMKLLWVRGIRPLWRAVILDMLKRQHEP